MSFPQPEATPYAVNNYGFFRLNTPLSSPGDIYESDQGGHAFALGPNSDIANVNMAYFDDEVPTFMQFITISPSRSLTGQVNARNDANFSPAHRPGKIFFWSDDIYDPNFRPRIFNPDTDAIQFVPPQLDVIQYFTPLASVVPARINKEFVFQNYVVPGGGTLYIVVPYYGRRYAFVNFTNRNSTDLNTFGISAVNYAITDDSSPNPYHQETTILAAAGVAANGGTVRKIIRASTDGMFDALVFSFTNGGPAPLRIDVSDQDSP